MFLKAIWKIHSHGYMLVVMVFQRKFKQVKIVRNFVLHQRPYNSVKKSSDLKNEINFRNNSPKYD